MDIKFNTIVFPKQIKLQIYMRVFDVYLQNFQWINSPLFLCCSNKSVYACMDINDVPLIHWLLWIRKIRFNFETISNWHNSKIIRGLNLLYYSIMNLKNNFHGKNKIFDEIFTTDAFISKTFLTRCVSKYTSQHDQQIRNRSLPGTFVGVFEKLTRNYWNVRFLFYIGFRGYHIKGFKD